MRPHRRIGLALVILAGGIWIQPRIAAPQTDESAAPTLIRLDAIVTDGKARPIRDFKPSDFEITDSGDIRDIESATLPTGQDGRLIAIFLDEYHVQPGENAARVRAALTQFVDAELRPTDLVAVMKPLDPLNAIRVTTDRAELRAAIAGFTGRKGDYNPRTPFEASFMSRAPATADSSRAQVVSSALQALALHIGTVRDGRKSVILLSEGFPPALPHGSDRLMGGLRGIVYAANRYAVAFYPIDPRPAADDLDPGVAALRLLADQTGGIATTNGADLQPGLNQAATELDDYYLLSYRAARAEGGKFHPVQARAKRSGAQIRTRSGFWAANPGLIGPALAPTTRATTMPVRPPHASRLIRPWVGTSRAADGLTTVTITWEHGLAPPRNQRVGTVILKATTDEGRVLFEQTVDSRAAFDASPGRIHIDMTILGEDGRTLDTDYRGFEVPNLHVARPTFASVQIVRTLSARQFALASASAEVVPVASREFSRAERLLIRVPVYDAGETTPAVTATLLNRLGSPMRVLSQVASTLPRDLVQFDLLLSSLAPGDYRVELVASGGGQEVKTLILFRVVN